MSDLVPPSEETQLTWDLLAEISAGKHQCYRLKGIADQLRNIADKIENSNGYWVTDHCYELSDIIKELDPAFLG